MKTKKNKIICHLTADKNLSKDVKIALVKMIKLAVKNLTKRKAVKK